MGILEEHKNNWMLERKDTILVTKRLSKVKMPNVPHTIYLLYLHKSTNVNKIIYVSNLSAKKEIKA